MDRKLVLLVGALACVAASSGAHVSLPPARALAQDASEHAEVRLGAVEGRSAEQLGELPQDAAGLLATCASEGRAAAPDEARVRATFDRRGRARVELIVRPGERAGPAARRWRECVVRALGRLRVGAGDSATVELLAHWDASGARAPGALGGLGRRPGSGLPSTMRRDPTPGPRRYPPDALRRVISEHRHEVRRCYARGSSARPDVEGDLQVRFSITGEGRVEGAVVARDGISIPSVTACVLRQLSEWSFPPPEDGEAIEVEHVFSVRSHAH